MNIVTLEEMYEYAESQGIHVDCYDMNHIPCLSIYSDEEYFIGINPFALTSYADELIDLTHEIGHCVTGAFYDSNSPQYWRIRCERIAEKWAIEKLVPKDKLIQAYIEGNVIHVRRSVAQKIKGKKIVETPPKNKTSYRDVQIPSVLIQILKEHKDRHKTAKGFSEDFRVCGGPSCLSDTAISNKNISFATQAGLPVIRIHDFRHSHASLLVNHGINIQEVARRLGHSKVEITWNTYSHLYPKEEDRALEVLESLNKT